MSWLLVELIVENDWCLRVTFVDSLCRADHTFTLIQPIYIGPTAGGAAAGAEQGQQNRNGGGYGGRGVHTDEVGESKA